MSKKLMHQIRNYILVIIGTFLLAFGSVIFLTKCELVAGGISGIAIIIQHGFNNSGVYVYDYVVAGLTVISWLAGLLFVGKDFAIHSYLLEYLYLIRSPLILQANKKLVTSSYVVYSVESLLEEESR